MVFRVPSSLNMLASERGEGCSPPLGHPPLLSLAALLLPNCKQNGAPSMHAAHSFPPSPPWGPTGAVQLFPSSSALNPGAIFVGAPAVACGSIALLGQVVAVLIALWAEAAQLDTPKIGLRLALSLH